MHVWHLNAGGPLQLDLVRVFRENFLWAKVTSKQGFSFYFEKFCYWFLLETDLLNFYFLEFKITGCDLKFITRLWISMIELFVCYHELFHSNRNKNQWIYQWICEIQIMWKLSCIFATDHLIRNSLNTKLCWLYSFTFYWFFPYSSQTGQIIEEHFVLEFLKNIKPPSLWKGSCEINPVHLSICLPAHLSITHFSQDLHSGFS